MSGCELSDCTLRAGQRCSPRPSGRHSPASQLPRPQYRPRLPAFFALLMRGMSCPEYGRCRRGKITGACEVRGLSHRRHAVLAVRAIRSLVGRVVGSVPEAAFSYTTRPVSMARLRWLWRNCRDAGDPRGAWCPDRGICDHGGRAILRLLLSWFLTWPAWPSSACPQRADRCICWPGPAPAEAGPERAAGHHRARRRDRGAVPVPAGRDNAGQRDPAGQPARP